MNTLANLLDGEDARAKLMPLVTEYREWIKGQRRTISDLSEKRRITAQELLDRAEYAAKRIEGGIQTLADSECLYAFCLANKCMADAARRRQGVMQGKPMNEVKTEWRPFQLAFLLMNLKSITDPADQDRNIVDLLFFPTGGGKTEAYLGLAAFTLILRRRRTPGITSAGLTMLMRYTQIGTHAASCYLLPA
jgi:hypothetical protein